MQRVWHSLKVPLKELDLENTLLNGQCFNWWKEGQNGIFGGIVGRFYVQIKRKDDEEVEFMIIPNEPASF